MTAVPNTVRIPKALENAIVAGQYALGVKLDSEELARKYDISRTPIREAHDLAAALRQPPASRSEG